MHMIKGHDGVKDKESEEGEDEKDKGAYVGDASRP